MSSDVIRPLRRPAGILSQIRIDLLLHQRLGECAEWLGHTHDIGSLWILHTVCAEWRLRLLDVYFTVLQDVQHLYCGDGIALVGRNHESVWRGLPRNRALLNRIEVAQPVLPIQGHVFECFHSRDEFVIDDIAQMPLTIGPHSRKLPTDGSRNSPHDVTQITHAWLNRRGIPHTRSFAQDPHRAVIILIRARRGPRVVYRISSNSGFPLADEAIHHGLTNK